MTTWSDVSLLSSIKYQVEWQSLSTFATMLRIQSPGVPQKVPHLISSVREMGTGNAS